MKKCGVCMNISVSDLMGMCFDGLWNHWTMSLSCGMNRIIIAVIIKRNQKVQPEKPQPLVNLSLTRGLHREVVCMFVSILFRSNFELCVYLCIWKKIWTNAYIMFLLLSLYLNREIDCSSIEFDLKSLMYFWYMI